MAFAFGHTTGVVGAYGDIAGAGHASAAGLIPSVFTQAPYTLRMEIFDSSNADKIQTLLPDIEVTDQTLVVNYLLRNSTRSVIKKFGIEASSNPRNVTYVDPDLMVPNCPEPYHQMNAA